MGVALGLIAIALVGAAGEPKPGSENVPIQYTVCFMDTEGMGWREAVFTRLTPVTRQGAATIWTAPANVKPRLLQQAIKDRSARAVQTTAVQAWSGTPAHFLIRDSRRLVTQVGWDGNDRPEAGKPETVRTGPVGTMAGRKMDQGILVRLVLEDTEIRAIHRMHLGGSTEPKTSPETKKAAYQKCSGSPACCQTAASGDDQCPLMSYLKGREEALGTILPSLPYIKDDLQFLAIPEPGRLEPSGTIAEIKIEGNASIAAEKIEPKLLSRVGQPIDPRKFSADLNMLMHTKWFSNVEVFYDESPPKSGKLIVTFKVHETPAPTHVNRAGATLENASARVSSDCACAKDDVIKAHREFTSPASPCCTAPTKAEPATKRDEVSPVSIEVPEIATQEIAGEWLIPKDGILLVSFGPHTVADKDGKAVIRERLAIVEAAGIADGAVQRTSPATGRFSVPGLTTPPSHLTPFATVPAPFGAGNLPAAHPALPSRTIPQGIHADGTPAELPPLPADDAEDASSSESAEPRPSPQTKKPQPATKPAADSQMKRTGHTATSMLPAIPSLFLAANPTVGFQFLMPIKAVSLKLPFNRRLEIEVFGRIIRDHEASAELVARPKTSTSR